MAKKSVAHQLATLTYRDMVDFSEIIAEALGGVVTAEKIAKVMSELPVSNEQTDRTNEMLQGMFNRKRQFTITPLKDGVFKIACPSFEGAVVFDKDVREGVSQLLDTLTVLRGLQ